MSRRIVAITLATAIVLAGCDAIAGILPAPAAGPQPCGQVYPPSRCQLMADAAAAQLHATHDDVVSLEIIPEPTPEVRNGVTILQTRGGAAPIRLRVTLADGRTRQVAMCGGIPSGPACFDDPHLETYSITRGGYHDVPEGSSPVPSAAPDALAEASALRIDTVDIPIDHTGPYEVILGEARLPNGLLEEAEFALVDDWPPGVTIIEGGVTIEVRSLGDGETIWNIYEHGWREGTERVEAVLVFDVFRFEPGAKLSIRDVVVR
jgi:hypothetical protein